MKQIDLAELIVNELAFRSLNGRHTDLPESTAEAVDALAERIRQGALLLYLGLVKIAEAIESREYPP